MHQSCTSAAGIIVFERTTRVWPGMLRSPLLVVSGDRSQSSFWYTYLSISQSGKLRRYHAKLGRKPLGSSWRWFSCWELKQHQRGARKNKEEREGYRGSIVIICKWIACTFVEEKSRNRVSMIQGNNTKDKRAHHGAWNHQAVIRGWYLRCLAGSDTWRKFINVYDYKMDGDDSKIYRILGINL